MLYHRLFRRPALFLATGLVLVAAALLTSSTVAPTVQAQTSLVVMAYNIHHGVDVNDTYNLQAIADVINAQTPALVAVNEVDKAWGSRSNFDDQPARLSQMTGLNWCYGPNLTNGTGQYGNLILSRYTILECKNTLLPKFNPGSEQRGLAEILVDVNGTRLRFYATHLQPNADDRRVQVDEIARYTDTQAEPKIIGGDFNAIPSAIELQPMYGRFIDAWQAKGVGNGYTYPATGPTARIDYLFHSSTIPTGSVRVVQSTASDHLAVVADLSEGGGGADTQPPTAPSNLTATAGKRKVTLGWTASTDNVGVTGYQVWRAPSLSGPFSQIATTAGTSYANTGLSSGATFYYYVTASDAAGNVSPASNTAGATAR